VRKWLKEIGQSQPDLKATMGNLRRSIKKSVGQLLGFLQPKGLQRRVSAAVGFGLFGRLLPAPSEPPHSSQPDLKATMGNLRRSIKKSVGQLRSGTGANKQQAFTHLLEGLV
jgi:biotin operon repressor